MALPIQVFNPRNLDLTKDFLNTTGLIGAVSTDNTSRRSVRPSQGTKLNGRGTGGPEVMTGFFENGDTNTAATATIEITSTPTALTYLVISLVLPFAEGNIPIRFYTKVATGNTAENLATRAAAFIQAAITAAVIPAGCIVRGLPANRNATDLSNALKAYLKESGGAVADQKTITLTASENGVLGNKIQISTSCQPSDPEIIGIDPDGNIEASFFENYGEYQNFNAAQERETASKTPHNTLVKVDQPTTTSYSFEVELFGTRGSVVLAKLFGDPTTNNQGSVYNLGTAASASGLDVIFIVNTPDGKLILVLRNCNISADALQPNPTEFATTKLKITPQPVDSKPDAIGYLFVRSNENILAGQDVA